MAAKPIVAWLALMIASTAVLPAAAAQPAVLEAAFGNTIVSTHSDGRKARLWLNRDHTYSAQGRKGQRSGGAWSVKGEKLCLTQKQPRPGLFSYCKRFPTVQLGSRWSDTAVTGERVTNEVIKGR